VPSIWVRRQVRDAEKLGAKLRPSCTSRRAFIHAWYTTRDRICRCRPRPKRRYRQAWPRERTDETRSRADGNFFLQRLSYRDAAASHARQRFNQYRHRPPSRDPSSIRTHRALARSRRASPYHRIGPPEHNNRGPTKRDKPVLRASRKIEPGDQTVKGSYMKKLRQYSIFLLQLPK
jgi:hypothetical protein